MKNGPYILVVAPEDYPGKRYRERYAYEHQIVWWQNTGEVVPDGWTIHHRNENKHDNRFDNLELMTKAKHTGEHSRERRTPKVLTCGYCQTKFERSAQNLHRKAKEYFCCREHQHLSMRKVSIGE